MTDPIKALAQQQAAYVDGNARLLDFRATDDAGAAWAVETAKFLRGVKAQMTEQKEAITKPLHAAHRAACALFKAPLGALDEQIRHLSDEAGAHVRRKQQAQQQALAAAAAASNPTEIAAAVAITTAPPQGLVTRTTYSARIVDEQAVPREWCCPDMVRLNAAAAAAGASWQPPAGVELVTQTTDIVRR